MIIFNITKDQALNIARGSDNGKNNDNYLNQESIIWKDEDFFGIISVPNGKPELTFNRDEIDFSNITEYGSRLVKHKNRNQLKPFKFKLEHYAVKEPQNALMNMVVSDNYLKETLFEFYVFQ